MALKTKSEEVVAVDNTAGGVGFAEAEYLANRKPTGVIQVICQVETAAIRTTTDGSTAPVAGGPGKLWNPGDMFAVIGYDDIKNFKAIRDTSTSAIIQAAFEGIP